MDLNILPLEERIVMDAAGGVLEASDAVYLDTAKALEEAESAELTVDGVEESARKAADGAAESILAGFEEGIVDSEAESCDEEDKQLLREASADTASMGYEASKSSFHGNSDWVKADNMYENDSGIDMLMRGI